MGIRVILLPSSGSPFWQERLSCLKNFTLSARRHEKRYLTHASNGPSSLYDPIPMLSLRSLDHGSCTVKNNGGFGNHPHPKSSCTYGLQDRSGPSFLNPLAKSLWQSDSISQTVRPLHSPVQEQLDADNPFAKGDSIAKGCPDR